MSDAVRRPGLRWDLALPALPFPSTSLEALIPVTAVDEIVLTVTLPLPLPVLVADARKEIDAATELLK